MRGTFHQRSFNVVEAFYAIAVFIAKNKKTHNIRESLVKPHIIIAADDGGIKWAIIVQGRRSTKKVKNH